MGHMYDDLKAEVERLEVQRLEAIEIARISRHDYNTVAAERDALRVERVQLQDENEGLRHDLAQLTLDERDRELLWRALAHSNSNPELGALQRLVRRLVDAGGSAYGVGSSVRMREGAQTEGGYRIIGAWTVQQISNRAPYSVRIGHADSVGGFWVRPEDIEEVLP